MKDILIISYNEGAKKFNDNNCDEIMQQITSSKPALVYVATQESISGGVIDHYQHHLKLRLLEEGYKLYKKYDASISIPTINGIIQNKNVRSRIYYNTERVCSQNSNCNLEEFIYPPRIQIKNKDFKKSTKSGFGSLGLMKLFKFKNAPKATLFKGSICTELILDINNNNQEVKFIFVNSHLFYEKKSNTGLSERIKEFKNLVIEFKLIDKWKNGYNIFFCGDLNFRLFSSNSLYIDKNKEKEIYKKSIKIIRDYITQLHLIDPKDIEEKKKISNELKKESELGIFLNKESKSSHDLHVNNFYKDFYNELKKSIDNTGIYLTAKYKENTVNKATILFSKKENSIENKEIENVFDILPKNGYLRVPSQTDVILYALPKLKNNSLKITIHPTYFKMHLFPNKSDHKMVSLFIDLPKNNSINN
jgi:hypothetical protein